MAFPLNAVFTLFVIIQAKDLLAENDSWKKPGCHRTGLTRKISIPDCVDFSITTNACRGYCQSWSIPSPLETMLLNPEQVITSMGQCCNIIDTENVQVDVLCLNGIRNLTFKSAKSCACYHCKRF